MTNRLLLSLCSLAMTIFFLTNVSKANAALISVDQEGEFTWNVLGAISFRQANNSYIASNEIVLENNSGIVLLNDLDISSIENDEIVEFEKEVASEKVLILAEEDKFLIRQRGVSAETDFPIKISESEDNIVLSTKTGERFLVVLPYEAMLQVVRANYIKDIGEDGKIFIVENEEGELAYKIVGTKNFSIFKFLDVPVEVNTYVSVLTGNILEVDQPVWSRALNFLLI